MGVYVRWHNEPRNGNTRDWPITELMVSLSQLGPLSCSLVYLVSSFAQVDRFKRHTDKQVVAHFWRNVDNFMAKRKAHLL
jgi:hypothetical protein